MTYGLGTVALHIVFRLNNNSHLFDLIVMFSFVLCPKHLRHAAAPQNVRDALATSVPFPKRLGIPEEYAKLAMCMIETGYFNGEDVRLDGAIRMAPR